MAFDSVIFYGTFSLCCIIYNISNFKLMQQIVVYILVFLAVFYIVKKYFFNTKKNKGCNTDCNCH
ncbi:FeoB-associated Cys-rich membrane protein [Polaribacter marinivivus]|uniref:FeoB-associated Cys-rich membrane protein n=1 Tax=Polaribacter marinivivus TaxID=1524260 RepID=A0ABV8R799_9FLAO